MQFASSMINTRKTSDSSRSTKPALEWTGKAATHRQDGKTRRWSVRTYIFKTMSKIPVDSITSRTPRH
ncbi:hypothetical protein M3J09_003333 [Ascochyta lentis]